MGHVTIDRNKFMLQENKQKVVRSVFQFGVKIIRGKGFKVIIIIDT